jgi:PKHD-type hydroxylase
MYRILPLLRPSEVQECREIAATTQFVEGRITNPHNLAKVNEQLHDPTAYQRSAQLLLQAFQRSAEFRDFAFPARIAPPLITRYQPGMKYGHHADAAYIQLPDGALRSDLSCTIFLSDPKDYEGGSLHVRLGDSDLRFKLQPGEAIIYPSDTLHQVEPVTKGERLVAISFIQSRVPDPFQRNMLFELNEVAALEGRKMDRANFARLELVQQNLLRTWGEKPRRARIRLLSRFLQVPPPEQFGDLNRV